MPAVARPIVLIAEGRDRWSWPIRSVWRDIHARIEVPIGISCGAVSEKWKSCDGRQAEQESERGGYALHGSLFFLSKQVAISDGRRMGRRLRKRTLCPPSSREAVVGNGDGWLVESGRNMLWRQPDTYT
jgi:hypothetical protein